MLVQRYIFDNPEGEELKAKLEDLAASTDNKLTIAVIEDILDTHATNEEIDSYITDVINYGCESGIVTSLIYYKDTDKFFTKYHNEIFELLNDYKEAWDSYPQIDLDSNTLAWWAYQTVIAGLDSDLYTTCF